MREFRHHVGKEAQASGPEGTRVHRHQEEAGSIGESGGKWAAGGKGQESGHLTPDCLSPCAAACSVTSVGE